MSRFSLVLVLAGCGAGAGGPALVGDGVSRDRADLLAYEYDLRVEDLGDAAATNDTELFVAQERGGQGCDDTILVFAATDLADGLREPSQVIECPAHLRGAYDYRFRGHIDARDDLMVAGPYVYRRTGAGWQLEAELGAGSPLQVSNTILLGGDQIGALVNQDGDHNFFVYERQGARWREVQRIEANSSFDSRWSASGDLLLFGNRKFNNHDGDLYHRDADGRWSYVEASDRPNLRHLHNGVALSSYRDLYAWRDGTLEEIGSLNPDAMPLSDFAGRAQIEKVMFGDRVTLLGSHSTEVWDYQGNLLALNDEDRLEVNHRSVFGESSFVTSRSDRVVWTHVTEPVLEPIDPDLSFVQTHDLVVAAEERVAFTVELPATLEQLDVRLEGTGDADLYVAFERAPLPDDNDCAPYLPGSAEACTFSVDDFWEDSPWVTPGLEGTWHVAVVGFEALSEVTVVIEATDLPD